jgi:hypothetical protein
MAVTLQRESTEYVYFGFTGDVPATGAEVAFLAAGTRPTTEWKTAIVVNNSGHALWNDAQASGVTGDYFIARLVGSFGANDLVLSPGDYQPWVRLTDTTERPVRIAPVTVTIA